MHKCALFPTIINDAISLNVFGNMYKTSFSINVFDIVCKIVLYDGDFLFSFIQQI